MLRLSEEMDKYGDGHNVPCPDIINDILNGPINMAEVQKALKAAKNKKACGSDGIPSEFLKFSNGHLDYPLVSIFNYVFDSCEYPSAWATGLINPIHKQNDTSLPENYRKITLLSSMSKIFEYILNNRLTYCKDALKTHDPMQNGFKKDTPATDNTFILNGIIEKYKVTKKPLYVCFVDFKSAFDFVNRKALLYKLASQNITGRFFKIIRSMLTKSKCRVKWDSELGEILDNVQGVLQGSVLSPSLFKIFLEDLPTYLNDEYGVKMGDIIICYMLQADDLALISETSAGLQKLIFGLQQFCNRWNISVNLIKTKIMIFNGKYITNREIIDFLFNGRKIEKTELYKFLGTLFTNHNDIFKENTDYIKNKALRAIADIRTNLGKIVGSNKPFDLYAKLFDSQILPIMEYGAEVWFQGKPIPALESVHLGYFKYVLNVKRQTSSLAVYGETGRYPLLLRQQDRVIKSWIRLENSPQDKPIYHVYCELKHLHDLGYKTWVSKVQDILNEVDLSNMPTQPKLLLKCIKDRRYNAYKDKWLQQVNDSNSNPILRTYCKFKQHFGKEAYLSKSSNTNFMSAIAKFRTSSHCLFIELGRHTRPYTPAELRICKYCDLSEIDDEFHMLLKCKAHKYERNILLNKVSNLSTYELPPPFQPN